MQIVLAGVHQRTAPIELRERLARVASDLPAALARLGEVVGEGFIISTCNRLELCARVHAPEEEAALHRLLVEWYGFEPGELLRHIYSLHDHAAVRHLYRVAAGLDSMVMGEVQIMAQLKAAMSAAHEAGMLGPVLHRLLQGALSAGKRARTDTGIARTPVSVVSVALGLAREVLGSLGGARVTILGAGRMAELALKHLHGDRTTQTQVIGRTHARAAALAESYGVGALPPTELETALRASDLVLCCTSSPEVVLGAELVGRATAGRKMPLLLIDLAVPRDVDPQVAALPGVQLFDVDDLRAACAANHEARGAEVEQAEALLDAEAERFARWCAAQRVVPTIRALRDRAEMIRAAELRRTLARLPELPAREQEAIQALSAAIVNKLLHEPITALKDPHVGGDLADAVQQLFHLG
jgi:glutamyl-tRNA reductase